MSFTIVTQIEIAASAQEVWRTLIAFGDYSEWNPFITEASGQAMVGSRLDLRIEPPGGKAMTFTPQATELTEGRVLEWLGSLGPRGIFDGRHRFELMATANGTRVRHSEEFTGILVPLLRKSLDIKTRSGFEAMNRALKQTVEARGRTVA